MADGATSCHFALEKLGKSSQSESLQPTCLRPYLFARNQPLEHESDERSFWRQQEGRGL
jgi:hypothetical protein